MSRSLAQRLLLLVCMVALTPKSAVAQTGAIDATAAVLPPLWQEEPATHRHPGARATTTLAPFVTTSLPEDAAWEGFVTPASNGNNPVMLEYHGKLVLANTFGMAGSVFSPHLSLWNGTSFEPLPNVTGSPYALAIWNDHLVVATTEFTKPATFAILMLNGAVWDTLGKADSYVSSLTVWQGRLVAGGYFTTVSGVAAPLVAAFDGSTWSAPGSGMSGSRVTGLTVHAGSLVAAVTGGALKCVAALAAPGGAWATVGTGFGSGIYSVLSDGVYLYASGGLTSLSFANVGCFQRWDGLSWTSLTTRTGVSTEQRMTLWNGKVVVTLAPTGGVVARLGQWDGTSFASIPGDSLCFTPAGTMGGVASLAAWGNKLVAAGSFSTNGATPMPAIATYDGTQWGTIQEAWSAGMMGPTNIMANDLRAWGGKLVVSGAFGIVADQDRWVNCYGAAAWDGAHWSPLGDGVTGQLVRLGEYAGDLIAFGSTMRARGQSILGPARWNGTSWSVLGNNAPEYTSSAAEYQAQLYIGSDYYPGGLWRLSGATWVEIPGLSSEGVYGLGVAGGRLVVGGSFPQAGTATSPNVAFWDGANWLTAGAGVNDYVEAIVEWLGQPVLGGVFTASGATPLSGVARWDGSAWQPMGTSAVEVYRLRVIDGELFASGEFKLPDDTVIETVAHWTGTDWHVIGSDGGDYPFEGYNGYLYQLGRGLVHGHPSHNLSRVPLTAVLDAPRSGPRAPTLALIASPNPSRGRIGFAFTLPAAGHARLTVVDVGGRVVATLADGAFDAGEHQARWSAAAPAGVYFARLEAPGGASRVTRVVRFE